MALTLTNWLRTLCRMYGLFQPPMGDDSTCHGGLVLSAGAHSTSFVLLDFDVDYVSIARMLPK